MICSFQFSHSVISHSLQPHELQHARPPCPSPTPGVYPNPCPLNQWCHPTISVSIVTFYSCPQSFPAPRSFPMSQLFASGGLNIGLSASTSVLPMNTQDWSPLGGTGWISLESKGFSRVFSDTTVQKHQFFGKKEKQLRNYETEKKELCSSGLSTQKSEKQLQINSYFAYTKTLTLIFKGIHGSCWASLVA